MRSGMGDGRTVGIVLLLQMACALIVPFVLMDAMVRGYPGFLEAGAVNSGWIRAGVAVAFLGSALTVFLAVRMLPILREYSLTAAVWFLAICIVSAALDAVHNASVISMLSVSERFTASGGGDAIYQAWGAAAGSMRRSAHIVQLVAIGAWMMSFYISLWRFNLVPRALSTLGIIGVASQFTGVTAMMFLGYPALGYLAMPLAPIHAATAIWLIVKGFAMAADKHIENA